MNDPRGLTSASAATRLRAGSLCTGYGGLDLAALAVLDAALAWCAETDRHASAVLAARFPEVPNLGDLTTADWAAAPQVDLVTAGFPCQDISTAGRGAGIGKGTRSGLWNCIAQVLGELRPCYVLVENVAALRVRGLGRVLADLAALGYDTQWASLRASDIGAAHRRDRIFILAHQPAALPRLLAAAHAHRGDDLAHPGRAPGLAPPQRPEPALRPAGRCHPAANTAGQPSGMGRRRG